MTKKIVMVLALMIVAVCLLCGGCAKVDSSLDSWKDIFKIPTSTDKTGQNSDAQVTPANDAQEPAEMITIKLYFIDAQQPKLAAEERKIGKVEGIARQTMQELIKGPVDSGYTAVFPAGTRLLDINIKPDGLCIVDLSGEANQIDKEQGRLMVQAVAHTLGQFSSVKEVSFLINGEKVTAIGGVVDVAQPVQALNQ
ncbi:MAG: GerMN domain-containing protein [Syntrophomonadaceae bacterium]|nr:GerMN domain-containing protein [Syntrophomonadaceae bacterium]